MNKVKGKSQGDFMFLRSDGTEWKKITNGNDEGCVRSSEDRKDITFHNLRHTFASLLAMGGTRR